jgi:hypothetical protein
MQCVQKRGRLQELLNSDVFSTKFGLAIHYETVRTHQDAVNLAGLESRLGACFPYGHNVPMPNWCRLRYLPQAQLGVIPSVAQ